MESAANGQRRLQGLATSIRFSSASSIKSPVSVLNRGTQRHLRAERDTKTRPRSNKGYDDFPLRTHLRSSAWRPMAHVDGFDDYMVRMCGVLRNACHSEERQRRV